MKNWREILESDEAARIKGKTQINFDKAAEYQEACELLEKLKQKGLLEYKAEDPREPYWLTAIQVRWIYDEHDMQSIPAKEMAEILSKFDFITVANEDEWIQLSSRLHGMAD